MLINMCAVVAWFGQKPGIMLGVSAALLAASFTAFCLMYDEPVNRARIRIAEQMTRISQHGVHADEYQRLQSMKVTPTAGDKKFHLTVLSGMGVASGLMGAVMLAWGLFARLT
jgi:hypothetical protein